MPSIGHNRRVRISLEHRTSGPLGCRQMRWQFHLGQAIWKQQPTVINCHSHSRPAYVQKLRHSISDPIDFILKVKRQFALHLVSERINLSAFRPAATPGYPMGTAPRRHPAFLRGAPPSDPPALDLVPTERRSSFRSAAESRRS